jgi:WXG100 family type VII secretion target
MRDDAYSLDTDGLYAVISELARGHAALAELATRLDHRIEELHLTWDGQAAEAHWLAQQAWASGFADMRDALDRMRGAADTAHANYTSAAVTNRSLWEQVL